MQSEKSFFSPMLQFIPQINLWVFLEGYYKGNVSETIQADLNRAIKVHAELIGTYYSMDRHRAKRKG